jgi:long-chain acyl-CoA synthetase
MEKFFMFEIFHRFSPDDIVVIHQKGELKRWQFLELVNLLVEQFAQLRLEPGSRVLLVLPNSLELLVSYYACFAAGLIAVPVNERLAGKDILRVFLHAMPGLVITSPGLSKRFDFVGLFPDCPVENLENLHNSLPVVAKNAPVNYAWPDLHPAVIFYTSGSTGEPKGVVYSHGTLRENSKMIRQQFTLKSADRSVICHCLAQNFGLAQLSIPFLDSGASIQIVDFGNPGQTAAALASGVSFLRLVPWFAPELFEYCLLHKISAPAIRHCIIGGDRVSEHVFALCRQALGIHAAEMFGLTETNTFCVNPCIKTRMKTGSVGLPMPGVSLRITNVEGQPRGTGEIGEIHVRTPALMKEYWRDKNATEHFVRDGWVATGDAGYLDEDDYLWFSARLKNVIIHDGDNIFPSEIEREISRYPGVREVAVVGISHEVHGECVSAVLVANADVKLDMQDLELFLRERLAETKVPDTLIIWDKLPRTKAGKVDLDVIKTQMATT